MKMILGFIRNASRLRTALVLVTLGTAASILWIRQQGVQDEISEYSSSSTQRTTELSKAVKKTSAPGKEVNLVMNDPSMSQKWGLTLTNSPKAWKSSIL